MDKKDRLGKKKSRLDKPQKRIQIKEQEARKVLRIPKKVEAPKVSSSVPAGKPRVTLKNPPLLTDRVTSEPAGKPRVKLKTPKPPVSEAPLTAEKRVAAEAGKKAGAMKILGRIAGPISAAATAYQAGKYISDRKKENKAAAEKDAKRKEAQKPLVAENLRKDRNIGASNGMRQEYEKRKAERIKQIRAERQKPKPKPAKEAAKAKSSKPSTPKKTQSFGEAFKAARASNKKVFTWNGKKYAAVTKEEVRKSGKSTLRDYLNSKK